MFLCIVSAKRLLTENELSTLVIGVPLSLLKLLPASCIIPLQVHGGQLVSGQRQLQGSHGRRLELLDLICGGMIAPIIYLMFG